MADLLLLLNDQVPVEDTLVSLRALVSPPRGAVVVLATAQRWHPWTSGIPTRYRAERQRALREIWLEQETQARTQLANLAAALQGEAVTVTTEFAWGDAAQEAHRLAGALGVGLIVFPVPTRRGLLGGWPNRVARRLRQNAPCSILLAQAAGERPATAVHEIDRAA